MRAGLTEDHALSCGRIAPWHVGPDQEEYAGQLGLSGLMNLACGTESRINEYGGPDGESKCWLERASPNLLLPKGESARKRLAEWTAKMLLAQNG